MNLDSARNRIKIIEGVAATILRTCEPTGINQNLVVRDAETIQRQCALLALDLREEPALTDQNAHLGTTKG